MTVDWLWNKVEVTGPDAELTEFVTAAQGSGFVAWERPAGEDLDYWQAMMMRGGAPSAAAADNLAHRYASALWNEIEYARSAAERGWITTPLDLNVLIPVPLDILRRGWHAAGAAWCWEHWGTRWPLRKVGFRFEHRRQRRTTGIDVVAVYEFLSGDWSPWRACLALKMQWPRLSFQLQPDYELDGEGTVIFSARSGSRLAAA